MFMVSLRPWSPPSSFFFNLCNYVTCTFRIRMQGHAGYLRGFVKCSCSYRWNFTPHQQTSFQDKNSLSLSTQTVSLYPYNFRTFRLVSSRFLGHQNDGNMLTLIYNRPKPSSFVSKRICNLRRQKLSKKDIDEIPNSKTT